MKPIKSLQLANKMQLSILTDLLTFRDQRHDLVLPDFEPSPEKNELEQHCFYMDQITACIRLSIEIQKTLLTIGIEATHGRMETQTKKTTEETTYSEESESEQV